MLLTNRESLTLFLKNHNAAEKNLKNVLKTYFSKQAYFLAGAVEQFDDPSPAIIPQIFDADTWHRRLLEKVERPILKAMAMGANQTLQIAKHRGSKAFGFPDLDLGFDLPELVLRSIRVAFTELTAQPYWQRIQSTTSNLLTDILQAGVESGASGSRIARRIREELGGPNAGRRARTIARTETTGALNAGHQAAGEDLQREGFSVRKTWSTTKDHDARADHLRLDGTSVANSANFSVGGSPAPFPGHYSLPAAQRANCRCGVITRVSE